jgi:hypothetical protein
MRYLFYCCLLAAPALANSQPISRAASVGVSVQRSSHFYTTFDGFPVNAKKYSSLVSGSPYFLDAFMPSAFVLADGKTYTQVKARLNLADNEVQYLDSKGAELVAQAPLKQLVISDTISRTDYQFVHALALPAAAPKKGWYQLLADGKVQLYKFMERKLVTEKPFNSASEEQRIDSREKLYMLVDNQFKEVKKWKDGIGLLGDKAAAAEAHIKPLKERNAGLEELLTGAVRFYNEK